MTFTEKTSRYRWFYALRTKDQVLDKLKLLVAEIKSLGFKLSMLHCDNGGEYDNGPMRMFAQQNGFVLHFTQPHTPNSNAMQERFNRVLGERARALLRDANLPKMLWPQAMSTATYVYNRLPSPSNKPGECRTPFEMLFGEKPDVSHMRVFGCDAHAYDFNVKRQYLDDRAIKGVFVGYDSESAAYNIYLRCEKL